MHLGAFISDCLGGYRERETPGSIPNPEAKPPIADNTASFRCGNVGRRLVHRIFLLLINLILLTCSSSFKIIFIRLLLMLIKFITLLFMLK